MIPDYLLQAAKKGIEEAVRKGVPFVSVAVYKPSDGIFPLVFNDQEGKVLHFVNVGAIGKTKDQKEVVIVLDTYQRIATDKEKLNLLLTGKMERLDGPQSLAYDDRSFHALNFIQIELTPLPRVVYSCLWAYHKREKGVEWDEPQTDYQIAEDALILRWIRHGYEAVKKG